MGAASGDDRRHVHQRREANLERRRLVAGARELIDRLRRATGLRVGVLTNGPSELQRHKLAVKGAVYLDREPWSGGAPPPVARDASILS